MATLTPTKPRYLFRGYLDDGTKNLAGKTITFKGVPFSARVINWGNVSSSIPYPTGMIEIADAVIELADTDGLVREWVDANTPFRRIGEIIYELEPDSTLQAITSTGREQPVTNPQTVESSDPVFNPIFTGEITGARFPPAKAVITMRSVLAAWLGRQIPNLITRDNFRDLPYNIESAFAPIIFGRVTSYSASGYRPQGVINCPYVDTNNHDYCVARHTCYSVPTVYRKNQHDPDFAVVNPSEYTIVTVNKIINGIVYPFTMIRFTIQQTEDTVIHADVYGLNRRWDYLNSTWITGVEARNPVDAIFSLIFYLLQDEINSYRFNGDSFYKVWTRFNTNGYLCDGAITEQSTSGVALSRILSDFLVDMIQIVQGVIEISTYQPESDSDQILPIDESLILKNTMHGSLPDKLYNRFRYRYARQNATLTEFTKSSITGQWGAEYTIDNAADQAELSKNGANPLLELEVELNFVRDSQVAQNVVKRRVGYYTLRSYLSDYNVPIPEIIYSLNLAKPISLTTRWGIGAGGWEEDMQKTYALSLELGSYQANVKGIRVVHVSDTDLVFSWTSDPTHTAQTRKPQLLTLVNGYQADIPLAVNLNDSLPAPPSDELLTVATHSSRAYFGFSPSESAASVVAARVRYRNIKFQENSAVNPRDVSAYVPELVPVVEFVGTLYPDQKPTTLGVSDGYLVKYYSTDFDRYFWWTGTAWLAIGWDGDRVSMFRTAPSTAGWRYCNGDTNVRRSLPDGSTALITVPYMTEGTYMRGSTSYSGPASTAPIAPTLSGSTANDGTHSHTGAANTDELDFSHTHEVTTPTGDNNVGHTHTGGTLSISSSGAHSHTGAANDAIVAVAHDHTLSSGSGSVASSGAHTHPSLVLPIASIDAITSHVSHSHTISGSGTASTSAESGHTHGAGTYVGPAHTHSGSTVEAASIITGHFHQVDSASASTDVESNGHSHPVTGVTGTVPSTSPDCVMVSGDNVDTDVVACPTFDWTVNITGSTDDESATHTHLLPSPLLTFAGVWDESTPTELDLDIASDGGGSITGTSGSSSGHTHTTSISSISGGLSNATATFSSFSSDLAVTGSADGAHTHPVVTLSGSTGSSLTDFAIGSISIAVPSSGSAHTHTGSVGDTGGESNTHYHNYEAITSDPTPSLIIAIGDLHITVPTTGSAHSHAVGTLVVSATGQPRAMDYLPYLRL